MVWRRDLEVTGKRGQKHCFSRRVRWMVMVAKGYECIYYHSTVYLKMVNFSLCILYHNLKMGKT